MFKVATESTQPRFYLHVFRAEWLARRTRNPVVQGSSPALTTTRIYFTVVQSSNPQLPL